jgi:hypothetical protein
MRILSTRVHGIIDYAFGLLLIIAPYLFGFANGGAAQYLPQALGAAIIVMSLVTDYELSLARLIPMPAHLGVDMLGGVLLAASPWLFGFSDRVYWPHLILGVIEIGTAAMTETRSGARDLTAREA